jgi:hypothetical protein
MDISASFYRAKIFILLIRYLNMMDLPTFFILVMKTAEPPAALPLVTLTSNLHYLTCD